LRNSRKKRGCHSQRRGQSQNFSCGAISTNIVLIGSELTALSSDTLEVFLAWCVCIADLEEKTLLANGLAVELLDNLLTYFTRLESKVSVSQLKHHY
jgi:hypothetical protein